MYDWLALNGLRCTSQGCEFIPISEFEEEEEDVVQRITDRSNAGTPRQTRIGCSNGSSKSVRKQEESIANNNRGYQEFQERTKSPLSSLLCCSGGSQ